MVANLSRAGRVMAVSFVGALRRAVSGAVDAVPGPLIAAVMFLGWRMRALCRWAASIARRWDFHLLGSPEPVPGHRRGLRKLSPDQIAKARDDTADKVGRIMLTFVGTAAFCALSLLSPDSALLGGNQKLEVPLAGPVSFFGFMLLGPAVLIALRVYLQVHVEHGERLDRVASRMPDVRAPTLLPLRNRWLRCGGRLAFYLLLPLLLLSFARKAAVFPAWGAGLFCIAVAFSVNRLTLPFRRLSGRMNVLASASAGVVVAVATLTFGLPHRPFNLRRANLSDSWLDDADLAGADLEYANLTGAHLSNADLSGAHLNGAHLNGADLGGAHLNGASLINADLSGDTLTAAHLNGASLINADLSGAFLWAANLTKAKLYSANLSGANLSLTDLSNSPGLGQAQLDKACGARAKLPPGMTLKPFCPEPAPHD